MSGECRKHQRLLARGPSEAESQWMQAHQATCPDCRARAEADAALFAAFRSCALDPVPSSEFDRKLAAKRLLAERSRTFRFWAPAFVGATLAGVAALALVQLLATAPAQRRPSLQGHEAHRAELPLIPTDAALDR
jgi:anti-sigma factor RsiW